MQFARITALTHLAIASAALAGPLNPPAGPITSTPGPESRIAINATNTPGDATSLFRITQPGSYYLTGNITGVAARGGIVIAASGVTIDLNGYELLGVPGSLDGIADSGTIVNAAIRNGSIRAWGEDGIDLGGAGGLITDIRAQGNVRFGIAGGGRVVITRCVGIDNGIDGIGGGNGSTITDCHASGNADDGIDVGSESLVASCTANGNGGDGFECNFSATVTACSASDNVGNGISVFGGCTIIGCVAYSNDGNGIDASGSSIIANNSVRSGESDGIRAGPSSHIIGNVCTNNGLGKSDAAAIRSTGADSRIEGNTCAANVGVGFAIEGTGNIIIRNTCSGHSTNWQIAANNYFGPIINRVGVATAAVSGNAAAETLGSTHPNANFTY